MRRLVLCFDGTNNTLTGGVRDTNVLKLVRHLAAHPDADRLVYYDPGVGSPDSAPATGLVDGIKRTWDRVSGLASGTGIYDNVAQGYLFLMRHWSGDDDRIYGFGFSRGAFTARAVAGMVNLFGIVRPEHEALLPVLVRIYFSAPGDDRERLARDVREMFTSPAGREAWVHWVGVWDTVESVGLPGPLAQKISSSASFHDKRMRHVRHALALDEHRWTFEPRLYAEPGDIAMPGRSLKQRWFPGVHSDVGGGYLVAESGLSNAALAWMIDEVAADLGVPRHAPPQAAAACVRHDALWNTPWWALAGMCLRDMQPVVDGVAVQVIEIEPPADPGTTVWTRKRPLWPMLLAIVLGLGCWIASGAALSGAGFSALRADGPVEPIRQATCFAIDQLTALTGRGLLAPGNRPWQIAGQPAWAMFWDTLFIACYGYLLARPASRAYAWLAGRRRAGSPLPLWRVLGFAPLALVGGDLLEDALLVASLALHGMGVDTFALGAIWLGAAASVAKFIGLAACVPLLLVRPIACWRRGSLFDTRASRRT